MCLMIHYFSDNIFNVRIWGHLTELTSSHQSTVIITTHYIEEAKMAHTVSRCCELVYKPVTILIVLS